MSLSRRLELLTWAEATSALVIEDDYDSEYRYGEHPIPALKELDKNDVVLYMGTFSKVLFPALRGLCRKNLLRTNDRYRLHSLNSDFKDRFNKFCLRDTVPLFNSFHLSFSDHVHRFNSTQSSSRTIK